jgi:hypothetical protein
MGYPPRDSSAEQCHMQDVSTNVRADVMSVLISHSSVAPNILRAPTLANRTAYREWIDARVGA